MKFGIDISKYQKGLNLNLAKAEGVEFVIIRAGFTGHGTGISKHIDPEFKNFYDQCKALNLPIGCYWFSCANTYDKGRAEAEFLYNNCLIGKQFEYPIFIDVEDDAGKKFYLRNSGKLGVTEAIKGFCEFLKAKDYYPGVYANSDYFRNFIDPSIPNQYDCWIAGWTKSKPTIIPNPCMWQFGGEVNYQRSTLIAGKICDQNYSYKEYDMRSARVNGY